jgi:outer membrane protein
MSKLSLSILLLLATMSYGQTSEPTRLSLQDCMDYAMKHNYTVRNAQLDILIQAAQNKQTAALAYPSISGKYEFNHFPRVQQQFINGRSFGFGDGVVPVAFSLPYTSAFSLSGSQILFDGSVLVALQARKAVLELATQKAKLTNEDLKYNIYKSYHTYVLAAKQYEILVKSIGFVRSIVHELAATYQAGLIEKIEVDRTVVQLNNFVNDSVNTANGLKLAEQVLKYQIGMDINAPIVLTDTSIADHTNAALRLSTEETDIAGLLQYRLATQGVQLREYDLRRYKLSALPTVVAIGAFGNNYGQEKFKTIYNFRSYESYSIVGLQANVNIFNGMRRKHQVTEAKLNLDKSKNDLEFTQLSISFLRSQARTSLKSALLQLKSQQQNLDLAQTVLDLAQRKYTQGVGSNLEVTSAQSEQLRTQAAYFATLMNIINAEADLKKALGMFN